MASAGTEGTPHGWVGMRTVAALRREQGVGPPRERDSLYRPIQRPPRRFNPLKVPKSLQVHAFMSSFVPLFKERQNQKAESLTTT